MTRTKYHESLDILKKDVKDMGKLATEAIDKSSERA
jgi:phosphate transport system protein